MNLLIISYYFVPSSCSNAKRPFYLAKGFLKAGWSVDVVASYGLMSPEEPEYVSSSRLSIYRIEDPYENIKHKFSGKMWEFFMKIFRALSWPDPFVFWSLKILYKINVHKYDKILLTVHPISLIVLLLSQAISKKAIIDFQDMFSPSSPILGKLPVYRLFFPLLMCLQKITLKNTWKIIFATNSYRKDYIKHNLCNISNSYHIPFFFDETVFVQKELSSKSFCIAYLGQFGNKKGVRTPEFFFQALALFLKRNPSARDSVTFTFYGPWFEEHSILLRELNLSEIVDLNPPVPYGRYIEIICQANVLLLLASKEQNHFVPSKMLDYLGAKRPILGFLPHDSETFAILDEAGRSKYITGETNVADGATYIESLWTDWCNGVTNSSFSLNETFSAAYQVPRVVKLLSED